jgi:glycosyltransferase involved in cell wall biosynthesis
MELKNLSLNAKKKRMLLLTDGNTDQASARIRAIQYIPLLEKAGFKVSYIPRVPVRPSNVLFRYSIFPVVKRFLWLKRMIAIFLGSWDIVFIQRSFIKESALRKLKNRTPVIFDFDDAIYLGEKGSSNRKKSEIMIKYADEVIISTEYLNEFCNLHNKKGYVIPSPVETERIRPGNKEQGKIPTIGWIGSSWTTDYLKVVESPLQKISKELPFNLLTIGARADFKISNINHISRPWSYEKENSDLNEMDIGIMPLPDNDFTRAKGGYKLYLYMAGGLPSVASPVGVNQSIIRNGDNGYLASTEQEWMEALKLLLSDAGLRKKLGMAGRNDAVLYYDRNVCFEKLLEKVNKLI